MVASIRELVTVDADRSVHVRSAVLTPGERVEVIVRPATDARRAIDLAALDKIAGTIDLDFEAINDLRRRSVL